MTQPLASSDVPAAAAAARVQVKLSATLGFAQWQNRMPIIEALRVLAPADRPLGPMRLSLTSEPAVILPRQWHLDGMSAGGSVDVRDLDVQLSPQWLHALTETLRIGLTFTLSAGEQTIATTFADMEALPVNHWPGCDRAPALVAAFVQPNDQATQQLTRRAAAMLEARQGQGDLLGYRASLTGIWHMLDAAWSACAEARISYALPPPSFERTGQKVRSVRQIVDTQLATCLDTTLLLAALVEAMGLHAVPIFCEGHALLGVWLKDESFDGPVVTDLASLRNRIVLREILVFETTLVSQRPGVSFAAAVERGEEKVRQLTVATFVAAVDLARARLHGVRPLTDADADGSVRPEHAGQDAAVASAAEAEALPDWLAKAEASGSMTPEPELVPTTREQRLTSWKNELLDLTMNNSLLNLKASRRSLRLLTPDLGRLEDVLAGGKRLRVQPLPDLAASRPGIEGRPEELRALEDQAAATALTKGDVFVRGASDVLDGQLLDILRKSRLTEEEGDANVLFLAVGALIWRHDNAQGTHTAPLLLLPVKLTRASAMAPFYLQAHDDDPRFNPTLVELLRTDFKLQLPLNYDDLPRDASGLDVDGILQTVGAAIRGRAGWEVVRDVRLALFSFTRLLLWRDLAERAHLLERSPIVSHLLNKPLEPFATTSPLPQARDLDAELRPADALCPLPADSSQMAAVQAAARGHSFVLIGPPGTGKSQTIVNIIAQCLAAKKRVLFVSAKAEALRVVYRRLQDVGLDDFCLSMHSHTGQGKSDVIAQLRSAWTAPPVQADDGRELEGDRTAQLRDRLNTYVGQLHRPGRQGLTPYVAMGQILTEPRAVVLDWPDADVHDRAEYLALADVAEDLGVLAAEVRLPGEMPLLWVGRGKFSRVWSAQVLASARQLAVDADAAERARAALGQTLPLDTAAFGLAQLRLCVDLLRHVADPAVALGALTGTDLSASLAALATGIDDLRQLAEATGRLPKPWDEPACLALREACAQVQAHGRARAALQATYSAEGPAYDALAAQNAWRAAKLRWWPVSAWQRRRVRLGLAAQQRGPAVRFDIETELDHLVEAQRAAAHLAHYGAGASLPAWWRGSTTDIAVGYAFLGLQALLWGAEVAPDILAPIAAGSCGREPTEVLQAWQRAQALRTALAGRVDLAALVPGLWRGASTERPALAALVGDIQRLRALAEGAAGPQAAAWLAALRPYFAPIDQAPPSEGRRAFCDGVAALGQSVLAASASCDQLEQLLQAEEPGAEPIHSGQTRRPRVLAEDARALAEAEAQLSAWCAWLRARAQAGAQGLTPLVVALEQKHVKPTQARRCFVASYAKWWLEAVADDTPELGLFRASTHELAIREFCRADEALAQGTAGRIRQTLRQGLPDRSGVVAQSDWGRLGHELNKKQRFMPMRKLLQQAGEAVHTLAPCYMMSPLSVAQFLPLDETLFDVVVFDEASQIRISEAIGAMARGRQVVMVGDPKQMPPTNFFGRVDRDDEDDLDEDGEMRLVKHESILDLCLAARLPKQTLRWHYRSRHEELIVFSNQRYYDNALLTFCSPESTQRAVHFELVPEGRWLAGKGRRNELEARALVDHLVGRIERNAFADHGHTVGVIAFNATQARYIEDLIEQAGKKSQQVAWATAEDGPLRLFVKNLETVQGDERDIIYMSVAYAPEAHRTELAMRFGPLNAEGGERRLNVAVTRARCAMYVFSSIRAEQMPQAKIKAQGVRDLKAYLAYAELGPEASAPVVSASQGGYESLFEQLVAERLRTRGWQVDCQVGVGAFRIDLGILDPDQPGRYLAGVECDGASYHSSATARDRDKVREAVLRGLGWALVRIWSTDWWQNPDAALERCDTALRALAADRRKEVARRPSAGAKPVPTPGSAPTPPAPAASAGPTLVLADLTRFVGRLATNSNDFLSPGYDAVLSELVAHVIEVEAPIAATSFAQKVARMHGFQRTGARIAERLAQMAARTARLDEEADGLAFWWRLRDPTGAQVPFRHPAAAQPGRPPEEICLAELSELAQRCGALALPREAALRELAKACGIGRLTGPASLRLERAIDLARQRPA